MCHQDQNTNKAIFMNQSHNVALDAKPCLIDVVHRLYKFI